MCKTLNAEIDATFPNMVDKDRGKIDSCLSGLKGVTSILRAVTDYGLEQLRVSAVRQSNIMGRFFLIHRSSYQ